MVTGQTESFSSRRRVIAGSLGLLMAGPLVAACGADGAGGSGGAGAAQRSKNPVTLRVKTWTNIINIPTWEKAFKAFNDAHATDKITIAIEHVPDDYDNKLITEFAGGAAPDVIYQSPASMQGFANRGITRDLSPDIKADKFNMADINPPAQLPYQWEGKIWALACWNDTRVLSINVNAFKAAGVALPPQTWDAPGWTMDDFIAAAKKLTNTAENRPAFVHEGVGSLKRFAWQFGAYYWNDDKVPTRSAFGTPENVTGLQWVLDLQNAHRVMGDRNYAGPLGGFEKMFPAGTVPITYAAYKHVTAGWQVIKDFEWSIAPMPKSKVRMGHVSPQAFATVSSTKFPAEAWMAVKDLSTGESNAIMASVSSMPSYKKTDVYKVANIPQDKRWMIKLLQDAMNTGKPEVPHPNVKPEMLTAMDAVTTDLLDGKIGAAETAKTGADKVNALFDQYGIKPK
jgi:multiple sugar transport system substrate-binding protein